MRNDMMTKAFNLLKPLPFEYLWTLSFQVCDVEGGYGWQREPIVSIYLVGEKCRKCGWSTIDGTAKDFDNSHCSRHSWTHDEACIFHANVFREFKKFESFISELMLLREQGKLYKPTRSHGNDIQG